MEVKELTPRQQKARARYIANRDARLDASSRNYYKSIGVDAPPARKPAPPKRTADERRAHKTEYNQKWRAAKRAAVAAEKSN